MGWGPEHSNLAKPCVFQGTCLARLIPHPPCTSHELDRFADWNIHQPSKSFRLKSKIFLKILYLCAVWLLRLWIWSWCVSFLNEIEATSINKQTEFLETIWDGTSWNAELVPKNRYTLNRKHSSDSFTSFLQRWTKSIVWRGRRSLRVLILGKVHMIANVGCESWDLKFEIGMRHKIFENPKTFWKSKCPELCRK